MSSDDTVKVQQEADARRGTRKIYTFEEVAELYRRFAPGDIDGEGVKVEVAGHSANIRRQIADVLKKYGFSVSEADDGAEALKLVKSFHPDLIILDGEITKIEGLKIAEALRANEEFSNTRIIYVSANKSRENIVRAYKLNVAAYILKPCPVDDIIRKVAECCEVA